MNFKSFLLVSLLVSVTFSSCEKMSSNIFEDNNIPKSIKDDFYSRYGNVKVTDAGINGEDRHISISFKDEDKLACQSIYLDGDWQMTIKDLGDKNFLKYVPPLVSNSFKRLGYNPRFDVIEGHHHMSAVTRRGIEHETYDFCFSIQTETGTFTSVYVQINEDGLVLLDSRVYRDYYRWWSSNAPFDFIKDNYSDADIRSYTTNSGYHEFRIMHDGFLKTVTFDFGLNFGWKETVFYLPDGTTLPETIMEEYQARLKEDPYCSGFTYNKLLFKESCRGNWYGFTDTNREDQLTIWIKTE